MKSSIAASYSLWHSGQRKRRRTARRRAKLSTAQAQRGQIRSQSISNRPCAVACRKRSMASPGSRSRSLRERERVDAEQRRVVARRGSAPPGATPRAGSRAAPPPAGPAAHRAPARRPVSPWRFSARHPRIVRCPATLPKAPRAVSAMGSGHELLLQDPLLEIVLGVEQQVERDARGPPRSRPRRRRGPR